MFRAGCKRACFGGGSTQTGIVVGQLLTCRTQFFVGGGGRNASIAAVSRNHVLAVAAPKLFMSLRLAVDKASVMSLGSLVLTVGELTCSFSLP